jgi:two-component system, OmpR family, sensor histidine kinase ChvG
MTVNLRRQLILVSLLLLSLPWAGCQFIREMEGALRQGQEQSLQATAHAVAAVVGERRELIYPNPDRLQSSSDQRQSIYAVPAPRRIAVDGYADGWEEVDTIQFQDPGQSMPISAQARAVTRHGLLYLMLEVQDPEVIYHNPGLSREPNGDRLVLRLWQEGRRQEYVIATAAPGSVRAKAASRRKRGADPGRIRGYWQDARGGYNLELEIPLSYTGGRLGFYVVNASATAGSPFETLGNVSPLETSSPPWLIYSPAPLQAALAPFSNQGRSIQVSDISHWLVGNITGTGSSTKTSDTFWLLRLLYRNILSDDNLPVPPLAEAIGKVAAADVASALLGQPANLRYRDPEYSSRTILAASAPVKNGDKVIGAVVVRQSGEQYLSLTDQAFSRLLGYSMLSIGIAAFGLLAYATVLSWRIRKLSMAAMKVVAEDGSISNSFPRSRAQDEIGELSRRYADMLDQLREYNDYLRTLSRKLSHELRTPITVIQTSLENLEHSSGVDYAIYLRRAREGLGRLNSILTAMSEASRLEESIRSNQKSETDLVTLAQEICAAYRAVHSNHNIEFQSCCETAPLSAAPELLAQALDKLVDNAASFADTGSTIIVGLAEDEANWALSVSNEGPTLPHALRDKLFDPMVTLRERESGGIHLGLGLHIVRLICDFHGGHATAENLPANNGVKFTLLLPRKLPG